MEASPHARKVALFMLRILTWNVHNPSAGRGLDRIVAFLRANRADVLALSECGREAFDELAIRLGCSYCTHAPAPFWGNGIMTLDLPMRALGNVVMTPLNSGEERSAAVGEVEVGSLTLRLVMTHLAHGSEGERLHQVEQLVGAPSLGFRSCVLLGDLNALSRADYNEHRWQEITEQRQRAGLDPPRFDLMDHLCNGLKFVDAVEASPTGDVETLTTSRFGTRVDYVLLGPKCPARLVAGTYRVLPARAQNVSDHDAVLVELEPAT